MKRLVVSVLAALVLFSSINSTSAKSTFVFVHGMGGRDARPVFAQNLKRFFDKVKYDCDVKMFSWNSPRVGLLNARQAGVKLDQSKHLADDEAKKFATKLRALDKNNEP